MNTQRLPFAHKEDRRGNFICDAPLHLCNLASIKQIETKVKEKFKDKPAQLKTKNVDVLTFRPNFLIDEAKPYVEDEFIEMRIANVLFRNLGPTHRCKTTSINWKLNIKDEQLEPYTTVVEERNHEKFGPVFGTYPQPVIIPTESEFKSILRGYEVPKDRSFGETAIIKSSDSFKLRKIEKIY